METNWNDPPGLYQDEINHRHSIELPSSNYSDNNDTDHVAMTRASPPDNIGRKRMPKASLEGMSKHCCCIADLYRDEFKHRHGIKNPRVHVSTTVTVYDDDKSNHVALKSIPTYETISSKDETTILQFDAPTTQLFTRSPYLPSVSYFLDFFKMTMSVSVIVFFYQAMASRPFRCYDIYSGLWYMRLWYGIGCDQIISAIMALWIDYGNGHCFWDYPLQPLHSGMRAILYLFSAVWFFADNNSYIYATSIDEMRKTRHEIVLYSFIALVSAVYHCNIVLRSRFYKITWELAGQNLWRNTYSEGFIALIITSIEWMITLGIVILIIAFQPKMLFICPYIK